MNILKASVVMGSVLLGLGCAGGTMPTDKLTAAEASMRAAQEVGAKSVPRAELHLKLAEEQVALAHKLVENGEEERAAQVLTRAKADAELAIALTRDEEAKQKVDAADARLRKLSEPTENATQVPPSKTLSSVQ
jgi:hypothetical protein